MFRPRSNQKEELFGRFDSNKVQSKEEKGGNGFFFRCLPMNCVPRLNSKAKQAPTPSNRNGGFTPSSPSPSVGSTDENARKDLLQEYDNDHGHGFDTLQWSFQDEHIGGDSMADISKYDDQFSLCSGKGLSLHTINSYDKDSVCLKDDVSIDTLEDKLLEDVSEWVTFSLKPKTQMKISASPKTPITKNGRKDSQGKPATEGEALSIDPRSTCSTEDDNENGVGRMFLLVKGKTGSVLHLPSFDSDETEGPENDEVDNDLSRSGSRGDCSITSDLSQSVNRDGADISGGADESIPPRPPSHSKHIDNFLGQNESSLPNLPPPHTSKGGELSHYMNIFFSDDDIDNNSVVSASESSDDESKYRQRFDDIGTKNSDFDGIYHCGMASI